MERLFNIRFSWYWLTVCGLFVLVIGYSSYKLTESPPTWFDEGLYIQAAQSLAERGVESIQVAPGVFENAGHITGGYPFLAPIALSLSLFGNSLPAARAPMVLFIVLCALAVFLVIYKLHGPRDALYSLLLFATFPLLYGNGKNVLGEVPGIFYTLLALYFLWCLERSQFRKMRFYIYAGMFIGLAAATKPVFFLLPLTAGLVFLFFIRSRPWNLRGIGVGGLSCVAPLALWVYLQFGGGDVAVSIFQHYANPYAESSLVSTVFQNFLRFFKEATPLYCGALMALWALATGIRVYRKEKVFLAEWAALAFSVLILLAYLRTAGWYRYFFEAMVLALIFAPYSLRVITREIEHRWQNLRLGIVVPVLLILLAALQFYQLNFSSWVAEHYGSTQTAMLEDYFSSFNVDVGVLVYNAPEIVPFLQTKNYYQYVDIEPTGSLAYGKENISLLTKGVPVNVVVTASNYQQHKDLFEHYRKSGAIGGYLMLATQNTK
ncbi:MAG: glycosyltransferase family 39 protein [bacterium]|nr:glycosyltransferase family 39 protein [bacterium]